MSKSFPNAAAASFFQVFSDQYASAEEQMGRETHYRVSEAFGSGTLVHYSLRRGIGIKRMRFSLDKDIVLPFDFSQSLFEIVFCTDGQMEYYDSEDGHYRLEKDYYGIYLKDRYKGEIRFPAQREVEVFSVIAFDPFEQLFCDGFDQGEAGQQSAAFGKHLTSRFVVPRPAYADLKKPFSDIANCGETGIAKMLYLESKAIEVLSKAYAQVDLRAATGAPVRLSDEDRRRLAFVERLLSERMTESFTLKELARAANLGERKLKEGFKALYGKSIFAYLKDVRMEKAHRLLTHNKQMKINDVVNEVGYSNTGHFAKAFREKWGFNPKDVRIRL